MSTDLPTYTNEAGTILITILANGSVAHLARRDTPHDRWGPPTLLSRTHD